MCVYIYMYIYIYIFCEGGVIYAHIVIEKATHKWLTINRAVGANYLCSAFSFERKSANTCTCECGCLSIWLTVVDTRPTVSRLDAPAMKPWWFSFCLSWEVKPHLNQSMKWVVNTQLIIVDSKDKKNWSGGNYINMYIALYVKLIHPWICMWISSNSRGPEKCARRQKRARVRTRTRKREKRTTSENYQVHEYLYVA